MTATQGFSSGRFGLRTRSALSGGRRIGLFGMVGSREEDCPVLSGSRWRTAVVVVGVSSILGKSLSLVLSYGKFKVTCG
jgi:hypothetical protein